jgi:hypothetical protein
LKITVIDRECHLSEERLKSFEDRVRFGLAGRTTEVERILLLINPVDGRAEHSFRAKFSASLKNRRQVSVDTALDATEASFVHATDRMCRAVVRTLERSSLATISAEETR